LRSDLHSWFFKGYSG